MKIRPGTDWATAPRTSPSCDTWRSTSCKRTQPRDPCAGSSSAPAGTTPTSPVCSPYSEVRLPCGCRGLDDSIFAGAAAITRPADQPNPELSGDVIQHLSLVFADLVQRTAAAGASFVLDVDNDLDPRQMGGQGAAIALWRFPGGWPGLRLG